MWKIQTFERKLWIFRDVIIRWFLLLSCSVCIAMKIKSIFFSQQSKTLVPCFSWILIEKLNELLKFLLEKNLRVKRKLFVVKNRKKIIEKRWKLSETIICVIEKKATTTKKWKSSINEWKTRLKSQKKKLKIVKIVHFKYRKIARHLISLKQIHPCASREFTEKFRRNLLKKKEKKNSFELREIFFVCFFN